MESQCLRINLFRWLLQGSHLYPCIRAPEVDSTAKRFRSKEATIVGKGKAIDGIGLTLKDILLLTCAAIPKTDGSIVRARS